MEYGTTKHEGKKVLSEKRMEDSSLMKADGAGFDWSNMAEEEIQANMALMAFSDSEKQYDDLLVKLDDTGFKASTYKRGLSILEGQILKYKESEVLFSEEIALLKRSVGHIRYLMGFLRTELKSKSETDKSKKGFGYNAVPSPHPLILNRPTPLDLSYSGLEEFKQPEVNEYGPRDSSVKPTTGCDKESDNSKENTDDSLKQQQKTDSSSVKSPLKVEKKTVILSATKKEFVKPKKPVRRSVSKRLVILVSAVNTGLTLFVLLGLLNTVSLSLIMSPKNHIVHCARPRKYFQNQAQSTVHKPFYKRTALTKRFYNQNDNTGRLNVKYYPGQGEFNAVKPISMLVWKTYQPNGASMVFQTNINDIDALGSPLSVMGLGPSKKTKFIICVQSNSQLNDKGFVDNGCSRNMSGNIAHLSDFKLKFNLFSVSQMCDKKNYVLFTDSECLVLSLNFKLPDENQILLKIPRQDNVQF
ncbi:hypothetical protein Tco_0930412 [Tanacetum coccineum]